MDEDVRYVKQCFRNDDGEHQRLRTKFKTEIQFSNLLSLGNCCLTPTGFEVRDPAIQAQHQGLLKGRASQRPDVIIINRATSRLEGPHRYDSLSLTLRMKTANVQIVCGFSVNLRHELSLTVPIEVFLDTAL